MIDSSDQHKTRYEAAACASNLLIELSGYFMAKRDYAPNESERLTASGYADQCHDVLLELGNAFQP